jgi:hypothetical protein
MPFVSQEQKADIPSIETRTRRRHPMNWIFEVYGDTYNSMLFQRNRHVAAQKDERKAERPQPAVSVMGFLGRNKGTKVAV